jgi:hypothetical protein
MSSIFISYGRHSEAIVKILAEDIEALGHTVWFDQDLKGGQAWWDHIIATVRDCEVFIFVLDPKALDSTACKREYGYATALGKPILPVLVAEDVATSLLPPDLSRIQFVDYRKQDRDALRRLAKAIATVPSPKPLPDPLPTPPEVPISYLGRLAEQIATTQTLSYEQQGALVFDLKQSLSDSEIGGDAYTLLTSLRRRHDLYARVAEEIDQLLQERGPLPGLKVLSEDPRELGKERSNIKTIPVENSTEEISEKGSAETVGKRTRVLVGSISGFVVGFVLLLLDGTLPLFFALLPSAGGAIAAAISVPHHQAMYLGAGAGWLLVAIAFQMGGFDNVASSALGGILGLPGGAILFAGAARLARIRRPLTPPVRGG